MDSGCRQAQVASYRPFCRDLTFSHNSRMGKRTRLMIRRWTALAAVCAVLVATAHARTVREPAPGVLLVADDRMADPRFSHAVVLLIKHDITGSWGLIINKPTDVKLAEVLPSLEESSKDHHVYFGGPVQVDHLMFLFRDDSDETDPGTGLPGIHWSDSKETLKEHLDRTPKQVRAYAGYAGWAPGQLAFEIAHGGWTMMEGQGQNVFSDDPEGLWRHLTNTLGGIAI